MVSSVPEILPYEPHDQTDLERFFGEVWQDSRFQFDERAVPKNRGD
jgi:hypothetical protein